MGGVKISVFNRHDKTHFIYTQDLKGCSAIVIVSTKRCTVAHIPPLPSYTHDPYICAINVRYMIKRMRNTF